METFREFTRTFFSLFLISSCFIGCCQSLFWIEELSMNAAKPPIHNYYHNTYKRNADEEYMEKVMNDTIEDTRQNYYY